MKENHKAKISQRKDSKETETEYELAELRKRGKQSNCRWKYNVCKETQ